MGRRRENYLFITSVAPGLLTEKTPPTHTPTTCTHTHVLHLPSSTHTPLLSMGVWGGGVMGAKPLIPQAQSVPQDPHHPTPHFSSVSTVAGMARLGDQTPALPHLPPQPLLLMPGPPGPSGTTIPRPPSLEYPRKRKRLSK